MHYRWFDREEELTPPEKKPIKKPKYFSRAMITGMLLSLILIFLGMRRGDLPILFLAVAFLVSGLRPLTNFLPETIGKFLSNLLFGFSVALFFGAIAMAFL